MKSSGKKIVYSIALCGLLISCGTSKTSVKESAEAARLSGEEHLEAVINNTLAFETFSSRLKLTIPAKKGDFIVNGTLKIKRGEMIQISFLIPIIRAEAVRIEITPERVLAIDRMNKRYADVPVSELRALFRTEIDYPILQSLFSNDIFLPGKHILSRWDYSSFEARPVNLGEVLLSKKSKNYTFSFLASNVDNRLTESAIETLPARHRMHWKYNRFVPIGNTMFPSEMVVLIGGDEQFSRATMELSHLSIDKMEIKETSIPSRYEKIGLEELMRMLEHL